MLNNDTSSLNRLRNLKSSWAINLLLCFFSFGVYGIGLPIVEPAPAQKAKPAQQNVQKNDANAFKLFDVDCDYGTLAFKGRIERTDMGEKFRYRIQIATVFLPGETTPDGYTMTNRTKVADLKICELVATSFVEEGKPYKLIQREWKPIAIRLTEYGEVGTLPEMEFFMPKSAVESASHVGFAVSGGGLAWPIPIELK
jgi:hypothetical protein